MHPDAPVFTRGDGLYLTRQWFQDQLRGALTRGGLDAPRVTTHSCRAGGAVTMLVAGCPGELVQMYGRWSSDCYLRYCTLERATPRRNAEMMAGVESSDLTGNRKAALGALDVLRGTDV